MRLEGVASWGKGVWDEGTPEQPPVSVAVVLTKGTLMISPPFDTRGIAAGSRS